MFQKAPLVGVGRAGWPGEELQHRPGSSAPSACALPCSLHRAPGSAPWDQLVPESAGSCPGESRTHLSPGPQLHSRCGTRALCVALRGGGTVRRVATLSALTSCLGLGEHLVLGHPVPAASLAASQGPAASRYAACPASHGVLPREGAWGPPPPVTQSSRRHGLPVQAPERPPGLRLQQGAGPHRWVPRGRSVRDGRCGKGTPV